MRTPHFQRSSLSWPWDIKSFHAQLSWAWNFSCSLMLKCQQLLAFYNLWARKGWISRLIWVLGLSEPEKAEFLYIFVYLSISNFILSLAELSMKFSLSSGPGRQAENHKVVSLYLYSLGFRTSTHVAFTVPCISLSLVNTYGGNSTFTSNLGRTENVNMHRILTGVNSVPSIMLGIWS